MAQREKPQRNAGKTFEYHLVDNGTYYTSNCSARRADHEYENRFARKGHTRSKIEVKGQTKKYSEQGHMIAHFKALDEQSSNMQKEIF